MMVLMEDSKGIVEGKAAKAAIAAEQAKVSTPKPKNAEVVEDVEIPQGVSVEINGEEITVKGPLGVNVRRFNGALLSVSKHDNKIHIAQSNRRNLARKSAFAVGTLAKELGNDMKGVQNYFEIRMETVFMHFPIILEAKGNTFTIKNIFGERKARVARIVGSTKVEVKDKNVRVYGTNLDDVSQTAANIRLACKVTNKDDRVFQDGVYYSLE
jgi:large subunit ribosomal protein L6